MSKDYAEKLESTWAKTRAEREAREAAQLAADSVPTENIAVLKERATRHAYESTDGYWGHFNDIQTALAQTVITPLLDTISRLIAERDALTSAPVESAGDETGEAVVEYGVRPSPGDGAAFASPDRRHVEGLAELLRGGGEYPDAVLVQRTARYGAWVEVAS